MSEHFIRAAIEQGVLTGVRTSPGDLDAPRLGLACPDFTQFRERMTHYWDRLGRNIQMIGMHGGMLVLDPLSPERGQHAAVVYQIRKAIKAKRVHDIEFTGFDGFVDWPCGVGHGHGMSAPQRFASAIRAGDYFKREVAHRLPVRQLFYLSDFTPLAGHQLLTEHPDAAGLTLGYVPEEMALFIESYREPVS